MANMGNSKPMKVFIRTALLAAILSFSGTKALQKRVEQYFPSLDVTSIPSCINITSTNETTSNSDAIENLGNPSAHELTCHPMSSSFRKCVKRWLVKSDYIVLENHTLVEASNRRMHPLGSYYINPGGFALTCHKGGACNNLTLQQGEYRIMGTSLHLELLNRTLPNATYTIDPITQVANVCYPFSLQFISCQKWLLERNEYQIEANKMLLNKATGEYRDPGEYLIIIDKRAAECAAELEETPTFDVYTLHAVVHVVSAICLAVTILVHVIIPDLSYQRAPLLCHASSLMIMYICLAARKFNSTLDPSGCMAIFYATYFFGLASFCWLSVLAFDIWRISAHLRKGTEGYSWVTTFCNKKMIPYSIFGWCVPLIFISVVAVIDSHDTVQDALDLYPRIANMCWFNELKSTYVFLLGPMCLLLVLNFVCFVLSVFHLYEASTKNSEFTNMKLNKQLLIICFVVFLAMGLFWGMEVVQYMTAADPIAWIVPDLINGSQGIIIAAVYTCRPLAWRRLREKAGNFKTQTVSKP